MGEVAVDHALFWLVANLALAGPLALVVDDAHWADRPSLRALLHLVVRLEDLPVAIVLAARPSEPGAHQDLLDRLAEDPLARHLRPQALSCSSAAALLEGRLQEVDPVFSAACHTATGGNPFVIEELASALAAAGVSPTAANAGRVAHVGPETVARSAVLRLRSQSAEAGALARSLAIHGGPVPLRLAARTAGIDERAAGEAADSLAKVDILAPGRPLEFAHPTVRAAVYQSLPRSERSAGHRAAAAMLFADGAAPETIASHLLHTEPAGDSWVVGRLAGAAEAARSVGALDSTVTYLKRALEEPAPAAQRAALLIGLGAGHRHRNEWDDSADALRAAIREAPEASLRVEAARQLFTLMLPYRRDSETAAELQDLLAELRAQEPDLALELELTLTDSMLLDSDLAPALAARIRGMDVSASGAERRDRIMCARRAPLCRAAS
jgi:tetratricopeptide (TPR) repeat protein